MADGTATVSVAVNQAAVSVRARDKPGGVGRGRVVAVGGGQDVPSVGVDFMGQIVPQTVPRSVQPPDHDTACVECEAYFAAGGQSSTQDRKDLLHHDHTQPALRLCEKVWTSGSILVERGTETTTIETRELGVVVCVHDEDEEADKGAFELQCGDEKDVSSLMHGLDCLQPVPDTSGAAVEARGGSQLDSIVRRLGPMLWQNKDLEAYADFLTYNDPVDDCKPMHGSLLPLWDVDVANARTAGRGSAGSGVGNATAGWPLDITCISWHETDPYVFAVGLGRLDGAAECSEGGVICVYSVMDLYAPRARIDVDVGVMSVAFSSDGRLAGGLQDGGVVVVSFGEGAGGQPAIIRSRIDHNHLFPVWNVRWVADHEPRGERIHITTTSHDGLEGHWQIDPLAAKATYPGSITRIASTITNQPDSYHKHDPSVFLPAHATSRPFQLKMVCCYDDGCDVVVHGTLEGDVGLNGTWHRHHTAPIYTVQTNPFDPRYILAASLDGSLSFWVTVPTAEPPTSRMVLDVDVGEPIVDARWSTQSSTICAAATESGNVCVFDLSVSKEVPICRQRVSNAPLTCLRFTSRLNAMPESNRRNQTRHSTDGNTQTRGDKTTVTAAHPPSAPTSTGNLLVLGTSDGRMIWLKLSPNLRIAKNATEHEGNEDFWGGNEGSTGCLDEEREIAADAAQADNLARALGMGY